MYSTVYRCKLSVYTAVLSTKMQIHNLYFEVGQGWPLLIKVTNDFPLIVFFLKSHPQAAYSSTRLVMQIGKRPKLLI